MGENLVQYYRCLRPYLRTFESQVNQDGALLRARQMRGNLDVRMLEELCTDICDELKRREANRIRPGTVGPQLDDVSTADAKRNSARKKLSNLPENRFAELALQVLTDLERRLPAAVVNSGRNTPFSTSSSARLDRGSPQIGEEARTFSDSDLRGRTLSGKRSNSDYDQERNISTVELPEKSSMLGSRDAIPDRMQATNTPTVTRGRVKPGQPGKLTKSPSITDPASGALFRSVVWRGNDKRSGSESPSYLRMNKNGISNGNSLATGKTLATKVYGRSGPVNRSLPRRAITNDSPPLPPTPTPPTPPSHSPSLNERPVGPNRSMLSGESESSEMKPDDEAPGNYSSFLSTIKHGVSDSSRREDRSVERENMVSGRRAEELKKANDRLIQDMELLEDKVTQLERNLHERIVEANEFKRRERDMQSNWKVQREALNDEISRLKASISEAKDRIRRLEEDNNRLIEANKQEQQQGGKRGGRGGEKDEIERLKGKVEKLEGELRRQRKTSEEVRRDGVRLFKEMRNLSIEQSDAIDREDKLLKRIRELEADYGEMERRYVRKCNELRGQKEKYFNSYEESGGRDDALTRLMKQEEYYRTDGLIEDILITRYQMEIEELRKALVRRKAGNKRGEMVEVAKKVVLRVSELTRGIKLKDKPKREAEELAAIVEKVTVRASNLLTTCKSFENMAETGTVQGTSVESALSSLTREIVELAKFGKVHRTKSKDGMLRERIEEETPDEIEGVGIGDDWRSRDKFLSGESVATSWNSFDDGKAGSRRSGSTTVTTLASESRSSMDEYKVSQDTKKEEERLPVGTATDTGLNGGMMGGIKSNNLFPRLNKLISNLNPMAREVLPISPETSPATSSTTVVSPASESDKQDSPTQRKIDTLENILVRDKTPVVVDTRYESGQLRDKSLNLREKIYDSGNDSGKLLFSGRDTNIDRTKPTISRNTARLIDEIIEKMNSGKANLITLNQSLLDIIQSNPPRISQISSSDADKIDVLINKIVASAKQLHSTTLTSIAELNDAVVNKHIQPCMPQILSAIEALESAWNGGRGIDRRDNLPPISLKIIRILREVVSRFEKVKIEALTLQNPFVWII